MNVLPLNRDLAITCKNSEKINPLLAFVQERVLHCGSDLVVRWFLTEGQAEVS